jgi:protein gp37
VGKDSKVEWCRHTLNFWIGCEKVSEACKSCYAEVETYPRVQRAAGRELWGKDGERHLTALSTINQVFRWNREAAAAGVRARVFVNSLSDFFEDRPDLVGRRLLAWKVMRECTHLDFLLLTKRPENIAEMLPLVWGDGYANVWLGCTVENQDRANERLPHLLRVPAVVHFVSCEPMLGWINLRQIRWTDGDVTLCMNALTGDAIVEDSASPSAITTSADGNNHLRWVIIGGESGRKPRPFNIEVARHLLQQCLDFAVAAFVKQLGANPWENAWHGDAVPLESVRHKKGGDPAEWPEDLRVRQFPRAA